MNTKKKIIYKLITLVITFAIIFIGVKFFVGEKNEEQKNGLEQIVETIPEGSTLNDVKLSLISTYITPYRNVNLKGNNLIDGSYANRTVFVFTVTGMKDLNKNFKSLNIYNGEDRISCDLLAYQYNEDEVIVFAACDNNITTTGLTYTITATDPSTGEEQTFEKQIENVQVVTKEEVLAGDLLPISEENYWFRTENTTKEDMISKNGSKGPYYEYQRTLNFISFGQENDIDINKLNIVGELGYEYDTEIEVFEDENGEYVDYKNESTTNAKKISIIFKVYASDMNEQVNESIIANINNSYIEYNGSKIIIFDGTKEG